MNACVCVLVNAWVCVFVCLCVYVRLIARLLWGTKVGLSVRHSLGWVVGTGPLCVGQVRRTDGKRRAIKHSLPMWTGEVSGRRVRPFEILPQFIRTRFQRYSAALI